MNLDMLCPKCHHTPMEGTEIIESLSMDIEMDGELLSFEGEIECENCGHEITVVVQYNIVFMDGSWVLEGLHGEKNE